MADPRNIRVAANIGEPGGAAYASSNQSSSTQTSSENQRHDHSAEEMANQETSGGIVRTDEQREMLEEQIEHRDLSAEELADQEATDLPEDA